MDYLHREVWSAHQAGHEVGKPARMSLLGLAGAPPLPPTPSQLVPTTQGETRRHRGSCHWRVQLRASDYPERSVLLQLPASCLPQGARQCPLQGQPVPSGPWFLTTVTVRLITSATYYQGRARSAPGVKSTCRVWHREEKSREPVPGSRMMRLRSAS